VEHCIIFPEKELFMTTQILATAGPASDQLLKEMFEAGLSGVRLNGSHADDYFSASVIQATRRLKPQAFIVYDIQGPKIRIGDLPAPLPLRAGMTIVLRTDLPKQPGTDFPAIKDFKEGIPVNYSLLDQFLAVGHRLFIDDGYVGLKVTGLEPGRIQCLVMFGDVLRSRKGINHPDSYVDYPYTMPYDLDNLKFAMENKVDYVADSFTRDGQDVLELRQHLLGSDVRIISKIENPQGVDNFDAILQNTDAIMIARGDLGVELDPWLIPELQKQMIEKCNRAGKPVITATQMLESMIDNPHPSRADVSDIANAVYDGSDIVMLSGETSVGKYPVECVQMMRKIASFVESTERYRRMGKERHGLNRQVSEM
jgi:pyruvate kinase